MNAPTLIVLTPVKNEAWILDRFLAVCSEFADLILIADQGSTDGSREIAARWPKVRVIENPSAHYDEAARQRLLIETARKLVPGRRVFLALDADEIVPADAVGSAEWQAFLHAAPGTVLMLEKADLLPGLGECVRYGEEERFPYGYVDDGAEHQARWIHSYRVPMRRESPRFAPRGMWLLHYAFARPKVQRLKMALYAVMENEKGRTGLKSVLNRRRNYGSRKDWIGMGRRTATEKAWFAGWKARGIDLETFADTEETWQAWAVLRAMAQRGERRFWSEDIWDIDWERLRRRGIERGETGLPPAPIRKPPMWRSLGLRLLDHMVKWMKR